MSVLEEFLRASPQVLEPESNCFICLDGYSGGGEDGRCIELPCGHCAHLARATSYDGKVWLALRGGKAASISSQRRQGGAGRTREAALPVALVCAASQQPLNEQFCTVL